MIYKRNPPKNYVDFHQELYPGIKIKEVSFQVTENCCLNCTYCYQNHKTKKSMTFETAKKFIDDLLSDKITNFTTKDMGGIILDFIGGEPLMDIKLIEQIWEYFLYQMIALDHPWKYHFRGSICSNGILYFTPEFQNFFKKYSSLISFCISIDGNKELHDSCRVDFNGNGSYDRAIAAVHHFRENYPNEVISTKMTLAPSNIHYTYDAVLNLINEGYEDIFLNCVFEEGWTVEHAKILYNQMTKIGDYLIENHLYDKINISLFDEEAFHPMKEEENGNWCGGANGGTMSIDPNGDYYTCIRYMESSLNGAQKPLILGDIQNGYVQLEEHKKNDELLSNITRRSQSTDECFYCPIAAGCAWCSAYNYEIYGTPDKRATFICIMHKARALANVYYWNKLYHHLNIDKEFKNYLSEKDINLILN